MKKSIKIITMLLIIIYILNFSAIVFGFDTMAGIHTSPSPNFVTKLGGNILGAVYILCTAAGIIAVLVAAIKYMVSSPSEKASIKGQMIGLAIGGIVLFGAPQILKILESTNEWW